MYAVFYSRNSGNPYAYVSQGHSSQQDARSKVCKASDGSDEKVFGVYKTKAEADRAKQHIFAGLQRELAYW